MNDDSRNHATTDHPQARQDRASAGTGGASDLSFDIDEQPVLSLATQRLTERTDLPIVGLPKPESRHMPLWVRLRLLWHRQVLRDAG
jgi:hypothetical protein